MIKAVIFDLDGTIGDTMPLCIAAFRKTVEPLAGRTFSDDEIMATFGPSEEGTIKALIPQFYDQGVEAYLSHYKSMHDMCPLPFDGITPILTWLKSKGVIVAMVTGKGAESCTETLARYDIASHFDIIETGSPLGQRKAEGIKNVLNFYGMSPVEAIYVGDAPNDIIASKKVGIPIVSAAWAETVNIEQLKALSPDELFTSISDLRSFLERALA